MPFKTLTYTSRAALDLTAQDLLDIHHSARHLNALDGITGLLVFDGTRFLQIVEGSIDAVDDLMERLRRDPRHTALEVRDERVTTGRSFPDWSMDLLRVSAGYLKAKDELEVHLPDGVAPGVRELLLAMSGRMATLEL